MNSCILMAQIIKEPELRFTPDNQTAIAEMLVQFPGFKAEDPPATLKVIGWGNLATEIQQSYHSGDRVVIEGRLNINTIERPEGFKEKRAELVASRIHPMGANASFSTSPPASAATSPNNVVPIGARKTAPASASGEDRPGMSLEQETPDMGYEPTRNHTPTPTVPESGQDLDDIPF